MEIAKLKLFIHFHFLHTAEGWLEITLFTFCALFPLPPSISHCSSRCHIPMFPTGRMLYGNVVMWMQTILVDT